MKPAVDANLEDRAGCIGRRGMAFQKIGMLNQAVSELQAALRMKPHKDEYRRALTDVEIELDNMDSSD